MNENLSKIPDSWCMSNLDDISYKITDGSHNPPPKKEKGIPMLSARNIYNDKIEFSDFRYISETDYKKEYKRAPIEKNDVLLTTVGTIGRSFVVKDSNPKFSIQRSVSLIKTNINPYYLSYFFQSPLSNKYLLSNARGTAQKGIYINQLKLMHVPIPPLEEQGRIVNKIEELFTRLDAGLVDLERTKEHLKVYRQSLLKFAFEGKLTQQWRETHREDKLEPASVLLEKIKTERKKLGINKEYELPKNIKLFDLPKNWIWINLDYLIKNKLIGLVKSMKEQNTKSVGTPYVKMNNITFDGNLDLNEMVYVDVDSAEKDKFSLDHGDILFNTRNSYELVGKTAIVDNLSQDTIFNNNIMRIRVNKKINPFFLGLFMNSNFFRSYLKKEKKATTNICALYAKDVLPAPVVLAPQEEQEIIAMELLRRITNIEKTKDNLNSLLIQSKKLRQSILKKAFMGLLLPQDPEDEPVELLLKRIKSEKEKNKSKRKRKRKSNQGVLL